MLISGGGPQVSKEQDKGYPCVGAGGPCNGRQRELYKRRDSVFFAPLYPKKKIIISWERRE